MPTEGSTGQKSRASVQGRRILEEDSKKARKWNPSERSRRTDLGDAPSQVQE